MRPILTVALLLCAAPAFAFCDFPGATPVGSLPPSLRAPLAEAIEVDLPTLTDIEDRVTTVEVATGTGNRFLCIDVNSGTVCSQGIPLCPIVIAEVETGRILLAEWTQGLSFAADAATDWPDLRSDYRTNSGALSDTYTWRDGTYTLAQSN